VSPFEETSLELAELLTVVAVSTEGLGLTETVEDNETDVSTGFDALLDGKIDTVCVTVALDEVDGWKTEVDFGLGTGSGRLDSWDPTPDVNSEIRLNWSVGLGIFAEVVVI